ncbi:MAG: hypothetical protein RLZZ338_3022 [Cyanobacteriota bacterium]
MFNETFSGENSQTQHQESDTPLPSLSWETLRGNQTGLMFGAGVFLVSVPVFIQAPLVREMPVLSLVLTIALLVISGKLLKSPGREVWGDLLLGFTWTWLTGGIYWGWLRWEPFLHLPVEAIFVPFALWGLARNWGKVGNWFYLGSLFGTAVTDGYFYLTGLIPYWRQLMQVEPSLVAEVFKGAIAQISTVWGISSALLLLGLLISISVWAFRTPKAHRWVFGGAVLGTILVDGLFLCAALGSQISP